MCRYFYILHSSSHSFLDFVCYFLYFLHTQHTWMNKRRVRERELKEIHKKKIAFVIILGSALNSTQCCVFWKRFQLDCVWENSKISFSSLHFILDRNEKMIIILRNFFTSICSLALLSITNDNKKTQISVLRRNEWNFVSVKTAKKCGKKIRGEEIVKSSTSNDNIRQS